MSQRQSDRAEAVYYQTCEGRKGEWWPPDCEYFISACSPSTSPSAPPDDPPSPIPPLSLSAPLSASAPFSHSPPPSPSTPLSASTPLSSSTPLSASVPGNPPETHPCAPPSDPALSLLCSSFSVPLVILDWSSLK